MAEGPPPIDLVRRIEAAIEGEKPDRVIFAMGVVLGRVISIFAEEEDYQEVIQACVEAIRIGMQEPPTEH